MRIYSIRKNVIQDVKQIYIEKQKQMEQKNETSRWVVVDIVEMIKEQLAIYSHLQELYKEVVDNIDNAISNWASENQINALTTEAQNLRNNIKDSYARRQQAMAMLRSQAVKYDRKCHCLLKHAIKEWWIAEEVWNTDKDNDTYEALMLAAENYMYKVLSQYLGTEIVTCWRCLADELSLSSNTKEDGSE